MSRPQTGVARVCTRLNAEEARYSVVGATAMQLWGTARSTRDIDILIEPTLVNAERVLRALGKLPFSVAADINASELMTRHVTMTGNTPNVVALTRAWNLRWTEAERGLAAFHVEGVPVPTGSLANLVVSKQTGRPQDVADIVLLEELRRLRGDYA